MQKDKKFSVVMLSRLFANYSRFENKEEEACSMAHDLSDIYSSITVLKDQLYPRLLTQGLTKDQLDDLLFDIGEEFRHIAYHMASSEHYNYLGISTPEISSD